MSDRAWWLLHSIVAKHDNGSDTAMTPCDLGCATLQENLRELAREGCLVATADSEKRGTLQVAILRRGSDWLRRIRKEWVEDLCRTFSKEEAA